MSERTKYSPTGQPIKGVLQTDSGVWSVYWTDGEGEETFEDDGPDSDWSTVTWAGQAVFIDEAEDSWFNHHLSDDPAPLPVPAIEAAREEVRERRLAWLQMEIADTFEKNTGGAINATGAAERAEAWAEYYRDQFTQHKEAKT